MKILRICPSFPEKDIGGGLEPHIYNLSVAQKSLGNEIAVICGGNKDEELPANGFRIYKFKAERPFLLKTGKRILENLPEIIRKEKPDIIHIHNPILPLSRRLQKPVIFTIHDSVLAYRVYRQNVFKCLKSYWEFFRASKRIAKNSDFAVSVSSSGVGEIEKSFGLKGKVCYIPSGVDMSNFNPPEKRPKAVLILTAGRFVKKKGLVFLVRAMKDIVKKYPDAGLVILGGKEGDEEYQNIQKEVRELGLGKNVSLRHVAHKEIRDYYRRCSVYVQPSFAEGLPKTLLEAMACGAPVVATNIDGHRDAVKEGVNGFLVETGDPKKLAEKIIWLLDNPRASESFGKKSTEIAKGFSWQSAAKMYSDLYKEVLKRKG